MIFYFTYQALKINKKLFLKKLIKNIFLTKKTHHMEP